MEIQELSFEELEKLEAQTDYELRSLKALLEALEKAMKNDD